VSKKYNQGVADANRRRTKHGGAVGAREGKTTSLYMRWCCIKDRCFNSNAAQYARYGGRGVTMHPEWVNDFAKFRDAVGEPPGKYMTLDRIDNEGNYEPGNVRWATRKEQANNRATNVVLAWEGETRTLKEWSEYLGWSYACMSGRWKAGKRGADLFSPPKFVKNKTHTHNGETKTISKWSEDTGVNYKTLCWRLRNGKEFL